ncbi:MAG: SDR family oxidoreductase [Rhodospirillaceae bacterium]|nr:MAG: SDR family oxidoreductase [Rhodospirillaceae bacterium]
MTEIKGRAAFVTGAGSGIGQGLAKALAAAGATVAVADILLDNAQAVAEEINTAGGKAVAIHCDVCERDSIKKAKAEANAALGPISLLFANAGVSNFDRLSEISDDTLDWILQVNFMGVAYCMQAFLPDMVAARDGHVMATASTAGLFPTWIPMHSTYAAAKLGIVGLMLNIGMELAECNIGSTVYCPGGVTAKMKANMMRNRPARFGGPGGVEVNSEASFKNITLTFLTPDEVAPMVLRAIRNNRPIVLDHSDQRALFQKTYVDLVMGAFDDVAAYEREHAKPK